MPSESVRTAASLFLVIHLFCVGAALAAVFQPSMLQLRLLDRLRPYTQLLNFDITYLPLYLTHATEADVDNRVEVLPSGADATEAAAWHVLPDAGWRGSDRYHRYQRLANVMAFYAEQDAAAARLAQAVARNYLHQRDVQPAQVRVRRHMLQSREDVASRGDTSDPFDPSYFRQAYAANVIISRNGRVDVVKIDEAGQVASPENEPASQDEPQP